MRLTYGIDGLDYSALMILESALLEAIQKDKDANRKNLTAKRRTRSSLYDMRCNQIAVMESIVVKIQIRLAEHHAKFSASIKGIA